MTPAATAGTAALVALAASLLMPVRPRIAAGRFRPQRWLWAGLLVAVTALAATAQGRTVALVLVLAGGAGGAGRLVAGARAAKAAAARESRVVELCDALAGELRAGQPPQRALEHCAATWPELAPAAGAARLGADVPAALRRLGRRPGARGLIDLAAAWQVSAGSGAGLARALTRVAESARHAHAARGVVASELASARATAWLVALLPLVSLTMGAGLGGDPWHFLLDTTPGVACLAVGVALELCGLAWVDRIATGVQPR